MSMPDTTPPPPPGFWRTPRGRLLLWLTLATLAAVLLAGFAILREARLTAAHFTREPVFRNLQVRLADAAAISIVSKTERLELTRAGDEPKTQHWILPAAHGYPADGERVHKLLWGLAELTAIEKKTARPDWLAGLSLDDPKAGGGAIAVTVKDSKGAPLAALLVGKLGPAAAQAGGAPGGSAVYVRRAGENQTFLAVGDLPLGTAQRDWLEATLFDLSRERIKRVALTPITGPAYAIHREKPEDPDFTIEALPKGREMLSATAANGVGAAAAAVTLEDVRPQGEVDFTKAAHVTFETFDGLALNLEIADKDEKAWARISAQGSTESTTKEAQTIETRSYGWAFALPSWKADLFRKPLDSLLKTPEAAKKPGKAPR